MNDFALLPCPFGHDPEDGELVPEIIDDGDGWHVECPCGIRGRTSMRKRSVVDEWNTRAALNRDGRDEIIVETFDYEKGTVIGPTPSAALVTPDPAGPTPRVDAMLDKLKWQYGTVAALDALYKFADFAREIEIELNKKGAR